MKYKSIFSLIAGLFMLLTIMTPVTVFAENEKWNTNEAMFAKLFSDCEDCNFIRTGGTNKLDGIEAETREETKELEQHLKENNYVLASTSDKEITDEDVEMLKTIGWNGAEYIGDDLFLSDGRYFRAYIYRPSLTTARKQWKENHALDFHVQWEISTSSVLINYYMYDELDKIGKTFGNEEINENLPFQYETNAGFVEFSCPIDAEIKLYSIDHSYYYLLYIRKGKTLMKMRGDHYALVEINGREVEKGDVALTNGNYFVVWQQPEDDPLQVEFSQLVNRDNITGIDITGKPSCEWGVVYEGVDVEDKGNVTVEAEQSENSNLKKPEKSNIILLGVPILIIGLLVVIIIRKKKR